MKLRILGTGILLWFYFLGAQAAAVDLTAKEVFASSAKSPFETILDWEKQGRTVLYKEVEGVHEGRCFPAGAFEKGFLVYLTVTNKVRDDKNLGPGFPVETERRAEILHKEGDTITKAEAINYVRDNWDASKAPIETVDSPVVMKGHDSESAVKKHGDYLIAVLKTVEDVVCSEDLSIPCQKGEIIKKGFISGGCYFFKELE